MSFFQKLFGIFSSKPPAATRLQSPATQLPTTPPISEAARTWIRQGGLVGPVGIQSNIPPSIKTKEDLDHLVADALAEFDALYPNRRIAEPANVAFDPSSASAQIDVGVKLKYNNAADFRANIDVTKALFDIFEKRGLPFKS